MNTQFALTVGVLLGSLIGFLIVTHIWPEPYLLRENDFLAGIIGIVCIVATCKLLLLVRNG